MQAAREQVSTSVDDRKATRVDLKRKVAFRFENLEGFMTEHLLNLSATGMFIRCQQPQPKGTVLDFELSLSGGEHLIRGHGEVMWARRNDGGPDQPAGMGVRFLHLDAETRDLLSWFVTRRYITGGGPCDMEELQREMGLAASTESAVFVPPEPPAPGEAAERTPRPSSPPASALHRGFREVGFAAARGERTAAPRLRIAVATAAAVLAGLYGLSRVATPLAAWTQARAAATAEPATAAVETAALETPPPTAAVDTPSKAKPGPAPAPVDETPVDETPVDETPVDETPATTPPAATEELAELATAWAAAWSAQRVDDYLACYAADFRPPGGLSRGGWEAQRRARILRPRHVEVRLTGLAAERLANGRGRVRFEQTYRSDAYRDKVHKTLELVREDGAWRIVEERVAG